MNVLPPEKDIAIRRMLLRAYSARVIAEACGVNRESVLVRRDELREELLYVRCPCGRPLYDLEAEEAHVTVPCPKKIRRNRLLLKMIRSKRDSLAR